MRLLYHYQFVFCLLCLVSLPASAAEKESALPEYSESERNHWSFLPRVQPEVPDFDAPADRQWIRTPIDAFVLRALKAEGLHPAPPADRRTLIRRVTFDLTGLPPTPEEIEAYLADRSPKAWEKVIDRLLASPHYGQRWGQHWLDVVRFAETEGFEYDRYRPYAWRYRDYVIRCFNEDKPFDRFVTEQLAGDELAVSDPRNLEDSGDLAGNRDLLIAAGFHRLGPVRRNAGNPEVAFSRNEVLTEMTDIVGAAFLGLSINCARCHDHMFDPIRQTDYYRLQAFLAATDEFDPVLVDAKKQAVWQAKADQINAEIEKIKEVLSEATGAEEDALREKLKAAESRLPEPLPAIFSVKNDQDERTPIHLLDRGDEFKKLQPLGMRPPGVLISQETPELPADTRKPKTRLAEWVTEPDHPLTARVIVNRIWQYHFGRGIVATPNDFGANGAYPSHPELLDWLANEFVENGWRMKHLHRLILLSSAWQQSAAHPEAAAAMQTDPDNALLWHFQRRRLCAEEIRDAMLAVSGRLNRKTGGPSIMVPVDEDLINLLYKPEQWQVTPDKREHDRRSIYLIAKRNLRLPFLEVFDQPDLQTSCFRRPTSTHAPQALELLNGRLSNDLARSFAQRLKAEAGDDAEKQIHRAFLLATGRPPTDQQKTLVRQFLKTSPLEEFTLAVFNWNAFLYVE